MTTVVGASPLIDDAVLRAAGGDRGAYRSVYDDHAASVFDLAARLLRDRHRALDVVQTTFVDVWAELADGAGGDGDDTADLPVLLLGTAARRAIGELRRGRTAPPAPDPGLLAAESRLADPGSTRASADLADAVWTAAAALDPLDYAIADLWLRRRLRVGDIAAALNIRPGRVARRGPDILATLDETVVALMIARHGRHECDSIADRLDLLPAHAPHQRLREVVNDHIAHGCLRCAVRRSSIVAPAEVLGALAPIPFPGGTGAATCWPEIRQALAGPRTLTHRRRWQQSRRSRRLVAVFAAAVAAALVAAAFLAGARDGAPSTPLRDPRRVHSASHEIGVPTTDNRIRIAWEHHEDATGFSVNWSLDRPELPDTTVDVAGDSTGTTSPKLPPGEWWFSLRTRGGGGDWTSTEVLGPFLVVPEPVPVVEPETTTTSSSTSTSRPIRRTTTTRRITTTAAPPTTATTEEEEEFPTPRPTRRSTTTTEGTEPPPETTTTSEPPPGDDPTG